MDENLLVNQTGVVMDGNGSEPSTCEYFPQAFLEGRFWLVAVCGTLISLVSACENLFLVIVLCQKKQNLHSLFLYILLLAIFDFLIAAFYIPLMSVSVLADYLLEPMILNAWFGYMRSMITICHISMTASAFLILAASFERFCFTVWESKIKFVNRYRQSIAAIAILLGFITKISMYFEYNIKFEEECVGTMAEYSLKPADIVYNHYYSLLWRIGFRNLVTIWLPFLLLLVMNIMIIHALRHAEVEPVIKQKLSEIQRKNRVRTATRTLILIVCTYLMANVLNVVLTLWEYFDIDYLVDNYLAFYTYGVDVVSILTVLSGVFRPLIYLACMPQVRRDVIDTLNRCAGRNKYKPDQIKDGATSGINMMLMRISELLLKYPNFTSRTSIDSNVTDETEKNSNEVFL